MFKRDKLPDDTWIDYARSWIAADAATDLLAQLTEELDWQERPLMMFGKPVMQPRLITWMGETPYKYSGQTLPSVPITGILAELTASVSEACGVPFNHVLGNRYRNGKDHMGWHADDEAQLGRNPTIAALSLGVRRRFALNRNKNKRQKRHYALAHGSLLVMGGACQQAWRHAVPKMAKVEHERINLTFRLLKGPPGWHEPLGDRAEPATSIVHPGLSDPRR